MRELLSKLYNYEYFGIYLLVSIIVLVILFMIILFFGKKDQKHREVEATKKLQQINNDTFKEESNEQKLEVESNLNQEKLENDTIIVPNISELSNEEVTTEEEIPEPVIPIDSKEEVNKVEDMPLENETTSNVFENELENNMDNNFTPILDKIEEKPIIFEEPIVESENLAEVTDAPKINEEEVIDVPTFNMDEVVKTAEEFKMDSLENTVESTEEPTNETSQVIEEKTEDFHKGPEIFSSVYVPKEEVIEPAPVVNEIPKKNDLGFELPVLKKNIEDEIPNPIMEEVKEIEPDTIDFPEEVSSDTPTLEEEVIDVPVLNDYNLDDLSGETYDIK